MTDGPGGQPRPRDRTTPHRLTDRDALTAQFARLWPGWPVGPYALAARDLVEHHPKIGKVDTWRRATLFIVRKQVGPQGEEAVQRALRDERSLRRMRKRLSWNFSACSRGPRWPLVELLVRHLVAVDEQAATLARLAALHQAARGHLPKGYRADALHPAGPTGRLATDPSHGSPEKTLVALLEQENADLAERLAASEARNRQLQADLARLNRRPRPLGSPSQGAVGGTGRPPAPAPLNEGRFSGPAAPKQAVASREADGVDVVALRSSGTGSPIFCFEEYWHSALRTIAGPVDRDAPPVRAADRFSSPGSGQPSGSNTLWR